MSPAVTRRRALATSAAAAIGLGVPMVAAAAAPAVVQAVSPEVASLQEEAGRLSSAYRRACREADETSLRVEYPDPPEALYVRPGDRRLFLREPEPSWSDKAEGRDWWANFTTIGHLREDRFRNLDGRACQMACARRDEVVGAYEAWQAADAAAEDAVGHTAAQTRFETACAAYSEFRARLVAMRTDDPEVLTVKALVIVDRCGRKSDRLDTLIERAVEQDGQADEVALALSMARDFIGLCGHSAWVSA